MEYSRLWHSQHITGIELLKASFQQFQFTKHWHDELAIGIIEQGAEGLNYRGSNIVIPENKIVAINPAEIHTGFAGCEQGWTYRMFYFNPEMIAQHFTQSQPDISPVINTPIIDDPVLFQLLYQLHVALEQPSLDLSKQSLLALTFNTLFGGYGEQRHRWRDQNVVTDRHYNLAVYHYLRDNWQDNVTIAQLAQLSGRSDYQVIRSFNAQYGMTPHQFLLLVKVKHAKQLLMVGRSCADTALECGFFDQSHLSRNFKRAFGVSPKRYHPPIQPDFG